jgi:hypothetical protein
MGAVDLAPTPRPVGAEPQVGFLEVSKQQELANSPVLVEAEGVLDVQACDDTVGGPTPVLPSQPEVLVGCAVDRDPLGLA